VLPFVLAVVWCGVPACSSWVGWDGIVEC